MRHTLVAHPDTPSTSAIKIKVSVKRPQPDLLVLAYLVSGEADNVRRPRTVLPARTDGLWQHTCFEAFVRIGDEPGYYEFNFSPSAEWAAYQFTGYRAGMANLHLAVPPHIEAIATQRAYTLTAELRLNLPQLPWHVGLTAVIDDLRGPKSYWALAHPPGKPDFHHPDGFALELP
ncbi:MAG: DOMON-like domain-containing protein [Micropepsaceae bacterium]